MSPAKWRFLIAYFCLVVLPMIASMGVLKHGRRVTAPLSVAGVWKVELDSVEFSARLCGTPNSMLIPATLAISQSGSFLAVDLTGGINLSGAGVLEGKTLKASVVLIPSSSKQDGCIAGRRWRLDAAIDPGPEARTLAGTLAQEACSSCGTVEFHAIRESPSTRGTP